MTAEPAPKLSTLKEDDNTLITELNYPDRVILRGTFKSPKGAALHIFSELYKSPNVAATRNHTRIFLHLPSSAEKMMKILPTFWPQAGGFVSIKRTLPDDGLHERKLGKEMDKSGSLCGHEYWNQTQPGSSLSSLAEFLRYFLLDNSGIAAVEPLMLDPGTLMGASRFYREAIVKHEQFATLPIDLKQGVLNIQRSPTVQARR